MINKITKLIFRIKIKSSTAKQRAKLFAPQMHFCGDNVEIHCDSIGTEPYLVSIHDNAIVASGVSFVTHDVSCFTMSRYLGLDVENSQRLDKVGMIEIDENAFIGTRTLLLPNVHIGKNAVVAAGSVVTKSIPDNEVWGGVPARYIMTTQEYAEKLCEINEKYPWMTKDFRFSSVGENELIQMRESYFYGKA